MPNAGSITPGSGTFDNLNDQILNQNQQQQQQNQSPQLSHHHTQMPNERFSQLTFKSSINSASMHDSNENSLGGGGGGANGSGSGGGGGIGSGNIIGGTVMPDTISSGGGNGNLSGSGSGQGGNASGIGNRSISGGSINIRMNMMAGSPTKSVHSNTRKEELQLYYQKCLRGISHSINIIKAVMMRLIFSLHSLIAIVYVYLVKQDEWYLVNIIGVVFLCIELFVTIIKRKGKEPRWFFPCFFIYICTMIPPIWFVELTRIDQANTKRRQNTTTVDNTIDNLFRTIGGDTLGIIDNKLLSNAKNIQLENIAVGLEISLLMLVILGRWFLPKGNISRSTLSQLLLVYMSLASDIVDLLSLLNETQVQESSTMHYFTLVIFSWSLFQFSLNLVVTRGRSFQSVVVEDTSQELDEFRDEQNNQETSSKNFTEELNKMTTNTTKSNLNIKKKKIFCISTFLRFDLLDSEIWSILITLIFQDGPFLALRLTAVIRFDVRTFVTMFFTCKNAIILFLQFYRLSAICTESDHNQNDALVTNKADALASLNAAASYLDKFVLLSHAQNLLIKNANKSKQTNINNSTNTATNNNNNNSSNVNEESERKLLSLSPILLRSNLSRNHTYAVVLTPNYNLNVSCCQCDCHPKEINSYP